MSVVLLCFTYFERRSYTGEYHICSEKGPTEWLVLINGVKMILVLYQTKDLSGILQPKSDEPVNSISPSLYRELYKHVAQIQAVRYLAE
jgi:hypothetical protein